MVVPLLSWLSRPLLLGRLFPEFYRARGLDARPRLMLFDLIAGLSVALATVSLGVMAAFALVFVPPLVAYRFARSWRAGMALSAVIGMGGYSVSFAVSLGLDQPAHRRDDVVVVRAVCAVVLVMLVASASLDPSRM